MPKLTSLSRTVAVSALSLLFATSFALAQTAAPEETADDSASDEGVSEILDGLSTGEVVPNEPQVGERYAGEKFGDWTMRCIKTESGNDPCEMFQLLNDGEGNTVAQFSVLRLPENQQADAGATVIVPLETALQAGLNMTIDDKPTKRFPFAFCDPVGCYAQIALPTEDVDALQKGKQAVLTIVPFPAPDQRVNATLSLSGFTAAYNKVTVIER